MRTQLRSWLLNLPLRPARANPSPKKPATGPLSASAGTTSNAAGRHRALTNCLDGVRWPLPASGVFRLRLMCTRWPNPKIEPQLGTRQHPAQRSGAGWNGRCGSGCLAACSGGVRFGFRDAAEGDFEAEGAELADVVGDLAVDVAAALV